METWRIEEGDVEFDEVGRVVTVSDKELLSQLVKQLLLTETDHRGFGASLGQTGFDITIEIQEAVRRWLRLQKKTRYPRPKAALLRGIKFLTILERRKTAVRFRLGILSEGGEEEVLVEEVEL